MKGLCRDCIISPIDGDDLYIGTRLNHKFHTLETIVGKTEEDLYQFSFFPINNCFSKMSFGGCERNIYSGNPAEMLHTVLLGLCDHIAEGIKFTFTESNISEMPNIIAGICKDSCCQNERNIPYLGHFRKELMSVKSLKTKDRFGRIFCVYLSLMNSHLICDICKRKKRKRNDVQNTPRLGNAFLLYND